MTIAEVPRAAVPLCRHILETYASETNKTSSTWAAFDTADLSWRPHLKSMTVEEVFRHHLLSERRFFDEFLGLPEPPADEAVRGLTIPEDYRRRLVALARPRLDFLAGQPEGWWLGEAPFFDVRRERAWIVWRRILHSAHHRTQLTVYLRLLNKPVVSIYGPTADVTWTGADPTLPR